MHYYDNILGLIGRTPLVKLNRMTRGIKATVLAKMENLNPGLLGEGSNRRRHD